MFFRQKKEKPNKGKARETKPLVFRGSAGKRLYAIGDVHGCLSELKQLLRMIQDDHESRPVKECIIVFLGDLIDRGPDSAGVIDFILSEPASFSKIYCLTGNHEEMFLRIFDGEPELIPNWLTYGGDTCLQSYGINTSMLEGHSLESMELTIRKYIPSSHIKFLESCLESIIFGDYILVHAGIDPLKSLAVQDPREMRWIREPFLSYEGVLEKKVIHGHTIEPDILDRTHRIGIDTGAYETGVLSALRIEDDVTEVLQT